MSEPDYELRIQDATLLVGLWDYLQRDGHKEHLTDIVGEQLTPSFKCPSMPVVSPALKKLEEYFGIQFIARPSHGTCTTSKEQRAERIIEYLRKILQDLEGAKLLADSGRFRTIRIGCEAMFEHAVLPSVIRAFLGRTATDSRLSSLEVQVITVDRTRPALDLLRHRWVDLIIECNILETDDDALIIDWPSDRGDPCFFQRVALFPTEQQFSRLIRQGELANTSESKRLRDKIAAVRDRPGNSVVMEDLAHLALAFCEYDDVRADFLRKNATQPSINLATNQAIVACVKAGFVGIVINWTRVVGDDYLKWSKIKYLDISDPSTKKGQKHFLPPLRLNVVRRNEDLVYPVTVLIEELHKRIEKIRDNELIRESSQ
jgi:DNA-binding transcriptional LysR family regulator